MLNLAEFLHTASIPNRGSERACAVLWWSTRSEPTGGLTAREICTLVEGCGYPGQNYSRLDDQLSRDSRVSRVPGSRAWRLRPDARAGLDKTYSIFIDEPRPAKATDSVLPRALFQKTRGYIEKVVHQINASYDIALYDCCAVMCRRLLETLIIETYEHAGRADAIKGNDGNFFMFAELLRVLLADGGFNISRNARRGLDDFKRLGDLSAHSRRYNAHRDDIDRVRDGIRVASEELLHLAGLA